MPRGNRGALHEDAAFFCRNELGWAAQACESCHDAAPSTLRAPKPRTSGSPPSSRQSKRTAPDYENSRSDDSYFPASLRNFTKFRLRGSHDLTSSVHLALDYSLLTNSKPDPTIKYDFSMDTASLSLQWLPKGGKWVTALLDYTRSSMQSSIFYLIPQTRTQESSLYHENAHTGTTLIGVKWLSAGGSFFKSSGSRPTQFYQPLARISVPLHKHVYGNAEWRYYGFAESGQPYYLLEGFRSNQVMLSLRLVR